MCFSVCYSSKPSHTGTTTTTTIKVLVSTAASALGNVLVNSAGLTLYGFIPDRDTGGPSCNDGCAAVWPPVIVEGGILPGSFDDSIFSLMPRSDGSMQLAAGIWPLYTYSLDSVAGDVLGQGVGDNWFAVSPDGTLIGAAMEGAPVPTPPAPVPPPGELLLLLFHVLFGICTCRCLLVVNVHEMRY